MEEIEHSVIHSLKTNPKLINPVPEIIGVRTLKLMTERLQSSEPSYALDSGLLGQGTEPLDHWNRSIVLLVKYDLY